MILGYTRSKRRSSHIAINSTMSENDKTYSRYCQSGGVPFISILRYITINVAIGFKSK